MNNCEHEPVVIRELENSYYVVCKNCGERTYHNYLSEEHAKDGWQNMVDWENSR